MRTRAYRDRPRGKLAAVNLPLGPSFVRRGNSRMQDDRSEIPLLTKEGLGEVALGASRFMRCGIY
jgi:hypothetical protein